MGQKSSTVWKKWTAWKLSLQKTGTADDAKVQTVAGGGDPGVLWFSVAGGGDPGTGLNEPGYRTAGTARQAARVQEKGGFGFLEGRLPRRPSRRQEQPTMQRFRL